MTDEANGPALDNLGPHLLGRNPSPPDKRNFKAEWFLTDDPLAAAFAALLASKSPAKETKLWAAQVMAVIHDGPPTPPPPTPPPSGTGKRWPDAEPTLDQGQTPHCIGFGGAQYGNTDPIDSKFTNADGDRIYYAAKDVDGEPKQENGSTVHSLAKVLVNEGLVTAYSFASTTNTITKWITDKGSVIIGSDWTDDMFNPDASGRITPTGSVAGGHCYILDEFAPAGSVPGIDVDAYGLHNSWGEGWGLSGRAYIAVADFNSLLAAQGEALCAVQVA